MNGNRLFLLTAALLLSRFAFSQYYYSDIVAMRQSQKQYDALLSAHVHQVSATSYSGNQPVENFKLEQTISGDGKTITINSSDPSTGDLLTVNTYNNGKLAQTKDSSSNVLTVTQYKYNADGTINTISTTSDDAFMNSHSTEIHQWSYGNGSPAGMLRIKDGKDSSFISFTYDNNNVAQETWKRNGRTAETYYYYYNSRNQLTDIVRFNIRVRKMLPDFLYEYDENGNVAQMMQVPNGSDNYLVWRYNYNDAGLKQSEMLYNKQQQMIGRVEYQYK